MMRSLVVLVFVASCGQPPPPQDPADMMPSATLEHQDPGADTSHNKTIKTYGSRWTWGSLFHSGPSFPSFGDTSSPPHYYTGCGGCASSDPSNALMLLALAPLLRRRRAT